jgi:hypothetical protein
MMRALVGLLLLQLCAGLRTGKDVSRLADDICTCLSWKQVYASGDANCGDAFELATWTQKNHREMAPNKRLVGADASTDPNHGWPSTAQAYMDSELKKSAWEPLHDQFCTRFFLKADSNTCVKVAPTSSDSEWFGQSWCYVDSQCQSLNGGVRVEGKSVSAKMCTVDEDDMLSQKTIGELAAWQEEVGVIQGTKQDHHPGALHFIVKMAYNYVGEDYQDLEKSPYSKPNVTLQEIKDNTGDDPLLQKRLMRLKAARMDEDVHYVYDHEDYDCKSKYVIYGNTTHHIWPFRSNCLDGCNGLFGGGGA